MPGPKAGLFDILFPITCSVCDRPAKTAICHDCEEELVKKYRNEKKFYLQHPPVMIRSVFLYKKEIKDLIEELKYKNGIYLASFFAKHMSQALETQYDYLIPVPLHYLKKLKRGYNQSAEIAVELSKLAGIPLFTGAVRIKNTKTQTNLNKKERLLNVKGAFRIVGGKRLKGKTVLIIDDVFTTGATTYELSRQIYKNEPAKVDILTCALAEQTI